MLEKVLKRVLALVLVLFVIVLLFPATVASAKSIEENSFCKQSQNGQFKVYREIKWAEC